MASLSEHLEAAAFVLAGGEPIFRAMCAMNFRN
jgi:hypothetical protein